MPIPSERARIQVPRGTYANLVAGLSDLLEGEICYARDQNSLYIVENGQLQHTDSIEYVTQYNTSHTLVASDLGKTIEINTTGQSTVTIPLDSVVNFPIGCFIHVCQIGAGMVSIDYVPGVTLHSPFGHTDISTRWGQITLRKRAANSWILNGDLAESI
jgi:hypothetical protein